jgi:predicted TIM-barrel fold metal-dependent hydrolase
VLHAAIDTHVHSAPDVVPRKLTDREVAQQAADAGMRAVVLKSHVTTTADRASIAEDAAGHRVRVFGGIVLNRAVGGPNDDAVAAALALGARVVWLPTRSARSTAPELEGREGIDLIRDGRVVPELIPILERIASADVVLATGHLGADELRVVVPEAQRRGVRRILVTHPELPLVGLDRETQRELARAGAMFERCWNSIASARFHVPLERVVADIRAVGIDSTVLATDFGQPENATPVEGYAAYLVALGAAGIAERDIERMSRANPAALLGL